MDFFNQLNFPEGTSPLIMAIFKECSDNVKKNKPDAPEYVFFVTFKVCISQLVVLVKSLSSDDDTVTLNYQNQHFEISRSSTNWKQLIRLNDALADLKF